MLRLFCCIFLLLFGLQVSQDSECGERRYCHRERFYFSYLHVKPVSNYYNVYLIPASYPVLKEKYGEDFLTKKEEKTEIGDDRLDLLDWVEKVDLTTRLNTARLKFYKLKGCRSVTLDFSGYSVVVKVTGLSGLYSTINYTLRLAMEPEEVTNEISVVRSSPMTVIIEEVRPMSPKTRDTKILRTVYGIPKTVIGPGEEAYTLIQPEKEIKQELTVIEP